MPAPKKRMARAKLTTARKAVNLTQRELALRTGCTTATIGDIESGRNHEPSHQKVVRIVRALRRAGLPDATADDLFYVTEVSGSHPPRQKKSAA